LVQDDPKLSDDRGEVPTANGVVGGLIPMPAVKSSLYLTENYPSGQKAPHVFENKKKSN
jgi:hypothetical protein